MFLGFSRRPPSPTALRLLRGRIQRISVTQHRTFRATHQRCRGVRRSTTCTRICGRQSKSAGRCRGISVGRGPTSRTTQHTQPLIPTSHPTRHTRYCTHCTPTLYSHTVLIHCTHTLFSHTLLLHQPDLLPLHRAMCVDWLIELVDVFDMFPNSAFLAVAYADRYLSAVHTLYTIHNTLYTIHCTQYTVYYTHALHTVHYAHDTRTGT
jgi:hypothetical protein